MPGLGCELLELRLARGLAAWGTARTMPWGTGVHGGVWVPQKGDKGWWRGSFGLTLLRAEWMRKLP